MRNFVAVHWEPHRLGLDFISLVNIALHTVHIHSDQLNTTLYQCVNLKRNTNVMLVPVVK